jgi:hypothetical protein
LAFLHGEGVIPNQTLACMSKLGLKIIKELHKEDPRRLLKLPLKKGEL